MEKNIKKISGVSIIEIMISMVIISIILIALVGVFPQMARHRKGIHEADQARLVAMEVLDGLQTLSANTNFKCGDPNSNNGADFKKASGGDYDKLTGDRTIGPTTYKVADVKSSCGGTVNTVDVKIGWTKNGKNKNITVKGAIR